MKRLTPLPRAAYRANPSSLARRQAELTRQRKNTAVIYHNHVLAKCAQIRRETKGAAS